MKNKDFLNQKAKDMSIKELIEAIKLKKNEEKKMPNKDKTGPKKRSPRPSKKKGGRKLGGCK